MKPTQSTQWPVSSEYAEKLGGTLSYLSGVLAQAAGHTEKAIQHFRNALADRKIAGTPVQLACVRFCLAESLLLEGGEGERREAVELLRSAARIECEGGAPLAGRRAAELLASLQSGEGGGAPASDESARPG